MLTNAQLQAIKAAVLADGTLASSWGIGDQNSVIAALNSVDAAYFVWRSSVPVNEIFDAIVWANLTPVDLPDGTTAWTNRSLACQGKQFNVQTMLTGRDSISGSKPNIRAGLQDALTNVPSGAGGATTNAGWAGVKAALTRNATRAEKLLISGSGTVGAPATLVFEGTIGLSDLTAAMAS